MPRRVAAYESSRGNSARKAEGQWEDTVYIFGVVRRQQKKVCMVILPHLLSRVSIVNQKNGKTRRRRRRRRKKKV